MRHLHKKALHQSLAYINIVILGGKLCAGAFQIKTIHDAGKLLTYIVGTLQRTEIDKVLIAPVGILAACFQKNSCSLSSSIRIFKEVDNLLCLKAW